MRRTLALLVVVGLSVSVAVGDDKPAASGDFRTVRPENDSRLAKRTDAQPKKVGLLTYYQNKGGGYTFMRGERVEFYSLPCAPTTYNFEYFLLMPENVEGRPPLRRVSVQTGTLGSSAHRGCRLVDKLSFGVR
jgi:hypothetical protein